MPSGVAVRVRRHEAIRRLLSSGGVDGISQLQTQLKKLGIVATRKTLYRDLELMPDFAPEEMRRHDSMVLAVFRKNLAELKLIRNTAVKPSDRLAAIREIRKQLESQEKIRNLVYSRKGLEKKRKSVERPTVVRFGDSVEVVDEK